MSLYPVAVTPGEDGSTNHLPESSVEDTENDGFGRANDWQAN
jgi:hypothetical protein